MTKFWRNYKRLRAYQDSVYERYENHIRFLRSMFEREEVNNKSLAEQLRAAQVEISELHLQLNLKDQQDTIEMLKARIAELVELNYRLSERR